MAQNSGLIRRRRRANNAHCATGGQPVPVGGEHTADPGADHRLRVAARSACGDMQSGTVSVADVDASGASAGSRAAASRLPGTMSTFDGHINASAMPRQVPV